MVLNHTDLKYVSLIYRKIRQKVPNGKGLIKRLANHTFLKQEMVLHNKNPETKPDCCKHVSLMEMALFL